MHKAERFAIDNAGHLFASVTSSTRRPRFRFVAVLQEDVEPAVLSRALEMTVRRFPYFNVELKRGFFWHFLEKSERPVALQRDSLRHFQTLKPHGSLLHIGYDGRKINLEMAHVLADGFGAVVFLKTLLVQYYRLQGIDVPFTHDALDTGEMPQPGEYEDGYKKCDPQRSKPIWKDAWSFRPESVSQNLREISVVTGIMNAGDVRKKARSHKVSVTDYLGAQLVQSLYMLQRESKSGGRRPVRISVSADLRKYYPTRTLRNFSGFCNAGIDPAAGAYTFSEILEAIHHQCRLMLTKKSMDALISKNIGYEKNILFRPIPLAVKRSVIALVYNRIGSQKASMDLTNMGVVELPEAIRDRVERFDTIGANLECFKIECGVMSYRDVLSVSFSRAIDQPFVENRFFELLVSDGISVKLEK